MKDMITMPVLPGQLNGQTTQLVDARRLHEFLGVGRDFSTWIKRRIEEYGFESGSDYLLTKSGEQVPHQAGSRTVVRIDYFLTLDMAKELAMVERTPRGRQARRYFIDCERQWQQLRRAALPVVPSVVRPLSDAQRRAINRQAWAEASGEVYAAFHARREALIAQTCAPPKRPLIPIDARPLWAR